MSACRLLPAASRISLLFAVLLVAPVHAASVSPDGIWARAGSTTALRTTSPAATFRVQLGRLKERLAAAPLESRGFGGAVEITIPMPDGEFARLRVVESPILAGDVARAHPDVRTYLGVGADDPALRARLDLSDLGVRAIAFTSRGTMLLDPAAPGAVDLVASTWMSDHEISAFDCEVRDLAKSAPPEPRATASWGADRRVLRFILTATGEFTVAAGGETAAHARLVTVANRLNSWFERDAAVRLQVVQLVPFPNPATDPYAWTNYFELLDRNTVVIDSLFGSAAYDLGAILTKITGTTRGVGLRPTLCAEGFKAASVGATHDVQAIDTDLVLGHELGHALGGTHTQDRACNRSLETPYEKGSGLTILCSMPAACVSDVQPQRDGFYHVATIEQLVATLIANPACGATEAGINSAPASDAGPDYTIPRSTPFVLTGSGADADAGDVLSYTWEQFDKAPASNDTLFGPTFRWRLPTAEPVRFLPPASSVLSGNPETYEVPPGVDRAMHFRLTVRDNHSGTGGVAWDEMAVTVNGAPFVVTSPNGGNVIESVDPFSVTWNVGGGSVATTVNILLSTDGGATWLPLAEGTPNDGTEDVQYSATATFTECRIKVEAVGNIFYDVSNANFTLNLDETPALLAQLVSETVEGGIAIRWRFGDPARFTRVVVERADRAEGPWMEPRGERRDEAGESVYFDPTAIPGREYFYRLLATMEGGGQATFGPIAAGSVQPAALAIAGIAPNPSSGTVRIDYTVPRPAPVRVEVLDVQGRSLAVLVDRTHTAGRHQAVWTGATGRDRAPGRYFVRVSSQGVRSVRSAVLTR